MEFNNYVYLIDDTKISKGVKLVYSLEEAIEYNNKNYGVFWAYNTFRDGIRRKENLLKINAWALDLDDEPKEQQRQRINSSPLKPTLIVESMNGYHLYWFAKDGTVENWKKILEERLIPYFNADIRAKDICRILRIPGFKHCKDPFNKFVVKLVEYNNISYTELEMITFFSSTSDNSIPNDDLLFNNKEAKLSPTDNIFQNASNLPLEDTLLKISGKDYVNYEEFDLVDNKNGTYQINVNGKPTSSWIDKNNKIGSYDRGGTTICNWLKWYGNSWGTIANILKKEFAGLI